MPVIAGQEFRNHYHIQVEFQLRASVREELAEEDFLHEIYGRIVASQDDDTNVEEAGALYASLVQFNEAIDHGIDTARMGDGISGELAEYWEQLFDVNTGDLKPELRVEYETVGCNLLILNCIEVYPKFRRHRIGLAAVQRLIDVFGAGCALIAARPYPLQFTPSFADDPDKLQKLQAPNGPKEEAVSKLQRYWFKIGFMAYGLSEIWLKNPSVTTDIVSGFGGSMVHIT